MNDDPPRFAFGKNWLSFVEHDFDESRLAIAEQHMLAFLAPDTLAGRRFLDIGCGSGLHSLAACHADASEVVSFDYDSDSVRATRHLRDLVGAPPHWRIEQGSVLDPAFMDRLGQFDIVYAWGVLHHTGDQWSAIRRAAACVQPGGLLYIALYTSDVFTGKRNADFWIRIKRRYNTGGRFVRWYLELWYAASILGGIARQRRNPIAYVTGYKRSRGMSFFTDVRDWVGGWPMEFSSVAEVKRFVGAELQFDLVNIATGEANTEYLFRGPMGAAGADRRVSAEGAGSGRD